MRTSRERERELTRKSSGKQSKRLFGGLLGVVALLATALTATLVPSAPAQAQVDESRSIPLQIFYRSNVGDFDPVISVDIINTGDCIGPTESYESLKAVNDREQVRFRTHEKVGSQVFPCEYQLEISTNLPGCDFAENPIGIPNAVANPVVANPSAPDSSGSVWRITLMGRTWTETQFDNANFGAFTGITLAGQGNNTRSLEFRMEDCEVDAIAPTTSSSIRYGNAEYSGDTQFTFAPQGGNCGTEVLTAPAGNPSTRQSIGLGAGCTVYTFSLDHAVESSQNCALGMIVYTKSGTTVISSPATGVRIGQNFAKLQESGDTSYEFVSAEGSDDRVVMFSSYLTSSCPQSGTVSVSISVGENDTYASSPIAITASSNTVGCVIDESKTLSTATNGLESSTFILTQKNTQSRPCSYTMTVPTLSGALRLVSDPDIGVDADGNPNAASDTTPATHRDGTFSFTATRLPDTLWFVYGVNNLNITVSTVFPDGTVFTTNDNVEYQITVPSPCGRYPDIISRALGGFGDFRSVQAYPGTTVVFDSSLASTAPGSLVSSTNQTQEPTFSLPPEVVVNGVAQPCSVKVLEAKSPAGCTVIGGNTQTRGFIEGLTSYTFTFDHDCGGASGASGDRGFTG